MESGADGVWHPMPPVDASIPSVAAPPRQGGQQRGWLFKPLVRLQERTRPATLTMWRIDVTDIAGGLDAAGVAALWRARKFMF